MTNFLKPKAALLIPSGPSNLKHLHIVMTNADKDGQQLVIPISSVKKNQWHDPACLLKKGEHEFLDADQSFALYRYAARMPARHIVSMVERKLYNPKADVSDDVFNAVVLGIMDSDFCPPWVEKYYLENQP